MCARLAAWGSFIVLFVLFEMEEFFGRRGGRGEGGGITEGRL